VERDEDRGEFLSACSRPDEKTVFKMVDLKGVDPSAALDNIGQNCLHFVVCSSVAVAVGNHKDSPTLHATAEGASSAVDVVDRQTALIQYLVQNGADINRARRTDGWTPLFLAAVFNMGAMVSLLLQLGASTAARDAAERTVDDWVDKYRLHNVKDLLEHSRSRIPQTRFSCVTRGPAPEHPTSAGTEKAKTSSVEKCQKKQESAGAESASSPTSTSSSASSSSSTAEQQQMASSGAEEPTEQPCLLTAQ